jgi:hypothetical protein
MDNELDLDAIEQEHLATSPGMWTLVPSEGSCGMWSKDDCPRGYETEDGHQEECKGCEHWEYEAGPWIKGAVAVDCGDYEGYTDADMRFCVHAHQYVPALIAEVRGLRAANATLRELCRSAFVVAEHDFSCKANRPHQDCTCWLTEWRESYVLQTGDNPALEDGE